MDAAEYKHLVLGMIFLKYISDTFVEQQKKVLEMVSNPESDYYLGDDPKDHQEALEDRDYYTQANVFWVPTVLDGNHSEIKHHNLKLDNSLIKH